jgi:hypothetical protein
MLQDIYTFIDAGHGDVIFWLVVAVILIESTLKWFGRVR